MLDKKKLNRKMLLKLTYIKKDLQDITNEEYLQDIYDSLNEIHEAIKSVKRTKKLFI